MNTTQLILSAILMLILTYMIYCIIGIEKIRKIEKIKSIEKKVKERKLVTLTFGNIEKTRIKLVQAGNPLDKYGINEYNFLTFKIIFTLVTFALVISDIKNDVMSTIATIILSWIIPDILINIRRKKRQAYIKDSIPQLLSITIDGLQAGQTPQEIIMTAQRSLKEDNPLQRELRILNLKLMKGNLKKSLDEFKLRIGLEEIDNYCFALLQYEIGGRAVIMLKLQLELFNSLMANKKRRETEMRSNYSSIATALLVGAMLIVILIPIMANLSDFPFK